MQCKRCKSERLASINAKCSDLCFAEINGNEHDGYVPTDMGISEDEDYVDFMFCLNCGQIVGNFPLPTCKLEENNESGVEYNDASN